MYIFNMSVAYLQSIKIDKLKVLGEADFTKYALSVIIQYVQWSKIG